MVMIRQNAICVIGMISINLLNSCKASKNTNGLPSSKPAEFNGILAPKANELNEKSYSLTLANDVIKKMLRYESLDERKFTRKLFSGDWDEGIDHLILADSNKELTRHLWQLKLGIEELNHFLRFYRNGDERKSLNTKERMFKEMYLLRYLKVHQAKIMHALEFVHRRVEKKLTECGYKVYINEIDNAIRELKMIKSWDDGIHFEKRMYKIIGKSGQMGSVKRQEKANNDRTEQLKETITNLLEFLDVKSKLDVLIRHAANLDDGLQENIQKQIVSHVEELAEKDRKDFEKMLKKSMRRRRRRRSEILKDDRLEEDLERMIQDELSYSRGC